jgi:hypothetical protein
VGSKEKRAKFINQRDVISTNEPKKEICLFLNISCKIPKKRSPHKIPEIADTNLKAKGEIPKSFKDRSSR